MLRALAALRRFPTRFWRARRGATAVEFAFVAAPFIALVMGTLELGLVFLVQTSLDNATDEAARQIRTGQLQAAGGTATTFKTAICAEMTWLTSCSTNLNVDVRTYTTFANQAPPDPAATGTFNPGATTFVPGVGGNIVLVRTYYQWTLLTPLINTALINLAGNKRLVQSTTTFRNEPFS